MCAADCSSNTRQPSCLAAKAAGGGSSTSREISTQRGTGRLALRATAFGIAHLRREIGMLRGLVRSKACAGHRGRTGDQAGASALIGAASTFDSFRRGDCADLGAVRQGP
jgi:hypothetical protein